MSTLFYAGLWWAETEVDGTPISASGSTEAEALTNLTAKVRAIIAARAG